MLHASYVPFEETNQSDLSCLFMCPSYCGVFVCCLFFNLKEALREAPNDEQPVRRAECFGESRATGGQLSALDMISLASNAEQSLKKSTSQT